MFDPSFFELIVICVVALLVLGPDRLPGAIKTLGLWIGRLRRSFNNIKREIEQEVGADEIRRQLRNEAIMEKFNSTKNQVTQSIDSVKKEAESIKNDLDLSKELSSSDEKPDSQADENSGEVDPVEKLATNDPAARIISEEYGGANNDSGANDTDTTSRPAPVAEQAETPTGPDTIKDKADNSGN